MNSQFTTQPGTARDRLQRTLAIGLALGLGAAACYAQEDTAAEPPPKPKWETSASAGLTVTEGNSETLLFTGDVIGTRKWDQNEWLLGASVAYGEVSGDKSEESLRGYSQYNRLFTERMFGYLRLDALHDSIADVEYRFTFSPGVGHYFIKSDRTSLSGEVGPGFVYEKQGGDEQGYLTLRLAERFEHQFNDRTRMWQSLEFLPQVDELDNFIVNAEIGLETDMTEKLSLRTYVQDTYDNQPAPGRKENDFKWVTGVKYKF